MCKILIKYARLLLTLMCYTEAFAAPAHTHDKCINVKLIQNQAMLLNYNNAVSLQLSVPTSVQKQFVFKDWTILYVQPLSLEAEYLFYNADPRKASPVLKWSGTAASFEYAAIRDWVNKNAKGLPSELSACFAQTVTTHS